MVKKGSNLDRIPSPKSEALDGIELLKVLHDIIEDGDALVDATAISSLGASVQEVIDSDLPYGHGEAGNIFRVSGAQKRRRLWQHKWSST